MPHHILKELETIALSAAKENGFDLYGVEVFTHLKPITMQVQIRHFGGDDVSLEECASFSTPMGDAIDAAQLLDESYVLEVSSPGINENLLEDRDFKTFRGFPVEVTYRDKQHSELQRTGLLHERSTEYVHLNIKGQISKIPRKDVIGVRLTSPTG